MNAPNHGQQHHLFTIHLPPSMRNFFVLSTRMFNMLLTAFKFSELLLCLFEFSSDSD